VDVKNLKHQGKKIIGTYCTYSPWELIIAAGAIPISTSFFNKAIYKNI